MSEKNMKSEKISESQFTMWRAVFSFAFVDNVLSVEEQDLLRSYLAKVPFTKEQLETLRDDLRRPKDVESLYKKITDVADRKHFCLLARALVWCEGNMDRQEEKILQRVGCLKDKPDSDYLHGTRDHPHLYDYYQQYARAGVMGLFKAPPSIKVTA
jgi:hypothetical protein